jgi:thioredoxin 2
MADTVINCPNCGTANRLRVVAKGAPHCGTCGKPLPWLVESDEPTFKAAVEESSLPVLVDFWAPWCGPCKIVEPVVEQISRDLAGKLKVVKINSDLAPQLGSRFEIRGIPTLLLFENGQLRDRVTGALPAPALRSWVDSRLTSRRAT